MSSLHDEARRKVNRVVADWILNEIIPKLPLNPREFSDDALEREAWLELVEELKIRWQ